MEVGGGGPREETPDSCCTAPPENPEEILVDADANTIIDETVGSL
jgi:hypothetical protein